MLVHGPLRYRRTCCCARLQPHRFAFCCTLRHRLSFDRPLRHGAKLSHSVRHQVNLSRPLHLRTINCPLDYRTRLHATLTLGPRTRCSLNHWPGYPADLLPNGTLHARRKLRPALNARRSTDVALQRQAHSRIALHRRARCRIAPHRRPARHTVLH